MEHCEFKALEGNTFSFRCYPGIKCFTQCCSKLRLVLTPYDILRIKRRLGLSSDRFLEIYTETIYDRGMIYPLVKLKMDPQEGRCPFVTSQGCTIYEDRPGACRLYPIGRATMFPTGGDMARERFFIVSESHCEGLKEDRTWTLEQWLSHEGMEQYNKMNDPWVAIVTANRPIGSGDMLIQKLKMFFMASYNLDRFRAFLFHSPFFERFKIQEHTKLSLAQDDVALMKFGFNWLRFVLFGEKSGETFGR